jgi:hypothetical protein
MLIHLRLPNSLLAGKYSNYINFCRTLEYEKFIKIEIFGFYIEKMHNQQLKELGLTGNKRIYLTY